MCFHIEPFIVGYQQTVTWMVQTATNEEYGNSICEKEVHLFDS